MEKLGIKKISNWKPVLAGLLLVHLFLLINLKFTGWPEMTLWPYLILKGWLPYKDIAIAHTPLLFVELSIFYKIFGVGLVQLKLYTWILILLTDGLLYFVAKRIWGNKTALLSLLFYIPLSLFYEGNGLWFDLALAPLALLIYYSLRRQNYLWAGIWWGTAFLTKQTAFWFLFPITITALQGGFLQDVKKRLKRFIQGVIIVFVPVFVLIWLVGILPEFIFWAFKFGVGILPKASGQVIFPSLRGLVVAMVPFLVLLLMPFLKKKKDNFELGSWVLAGVIGAFPRWELFHLQPAIPFLAIFWSLAALEIARMKTWYKYAFGAVILATLLLFIRFIESDWGKETRFFEPDVLKVASYIKQNSKTNEKIYIINAWDSLYVFSDTLPAVKPWIPHFSWYIELPGIQEKMVRDLSQTKPKLIIQGEYSETGLSSYKPKLIDEFISKYYVVENKIGEYLILTRDLKKTVRFSARMN